jgi:deoxyribose-phosphate aldolase
LIHFYKRLITMVAGPNNPGVDLDLAWIQGVKVNLAAVKRRAETLGTRRTVKQQWQAGWLLRAVTCIDLTTLAGDDTPSNTSRLALKAARPIRPDILKAMDAEDLKITCGAVCVSKQGKGDRGFSGKVWS